MPLYIRSVIANKYSLVGYIILLVGIIMLTLGLMRDQSIPGTIAALGVGIALLAISRFGLVTMRVYRHVMRHYEQYRVVPLGIGRMGHQHHAGLMLAINDIDREQEEKARQEPP